MIKYTQFNNYYLDEIKFTIVLEFRTKNNSYPDICYDTFRTEC